MKSEWVDGIKLQCDRAHVAFFFKQWGVWSPDGRKLNESEWPEILRPRGPQGQARISETKIESDPDG